MVGRQQNTSQSSQFMTMKMTSQSSQFIVWAILLQRKHTYVVVNGSKPKSFPSHCIKAIFPWQLSTLIKNLIPQHFTQLEDIFKIFSMSLQ